MSGISIDQRGAVSTWWEACSSDGNDGSRSSLAGSVTAHGAEDLQGIEPAESLNDYIVDSLAKLYGVDGAEMACCERMR